MHILHLGRSKIYKFTLFVISLLGLAWVTYLIIKLTVEWTNRTQTSMDVFYRPFKHHRVKIEPISKYLFPFYELELNDYEKLNNLTNFKFIINSKDICVRSKVFILVLIPSAPTNKYQRSTIRETWGNVDRSIVVVFLLGSVNDQDTQNEIKEESHIYSDIIQGNFLDTYKNLSYKTIMCLKFAIYHCPQALYILKIDDDSFANIPLLKNFLKNDISPLGTKNLFLCNDMTGSPALRDNTSKWYVSEKEFAGDFYPTYCSGWYALFSPDVCFQLYRESQKIKYFYIEDVFMYGIAASNVPGLKHYDITHYTLAFRNYELLFNGTYDNLNILFGTPNMSPALIKQFWEYFRKKPVPFSLYKKFGSF